MFYSRIFCIAFSMAWSAGAAAAQSLPSRPYLPMEKATQAAQAAIKACEDKGFRVSVAVVGRDGESSVLLRADHAGPHTTGSATGKAFTSASLGRPSGALAGAIANTPQIAGLRDMDPRLVILGGGLPVRFDGTIVAGIGVGGAPSGSIDAECANAGLEAIGAEIDEK